MSRSSRFALPIALVPVLACLVALVALMPGEATAQSSADSFALATFPGEAYILDAIAQQQGYFTKNGLKINEVVPTGGAQTTQFLVAGKISGWTTNPALAFAAIAQGQPLYIVGTLPNWMTYGIQMRKDLKLPARNAPVLDRIRALQGKTIGVASIGGVTYVALLAALHYANVPVNKVHIVPVGTAPTAAPQLSNKTIDGYVTYTNSDAGFLRQNANTVEYVNFLHDKDVPPAMHALSTVAMMTSKGYWTSHAADMKAYVKSLGQALVWMRANPKAAAKLLSDTSYGGQLLAICQNAVNLLIKGSAGDDPTLKPTRAAVGGVVGLMVQTGQLKAGSVPTYQELVPANAR